MRRAALMTAAASLGATAVALAAVFSTGALADTTPELSSYGADASGTGVHVLGATNAFPNFRTGFLDNSYPLATSHLDASPATQATASVADSGPLGSTAAGLANGTQQPQYAVASFPGTAKASKTQGVSTADAAATETAAASRGAVVTIGSSGAATVEDPKDPLHTSADAAASRVAIERATRTVAATSSGHVARALFGGGALVISGVDVRASVLTDGRRATPHYEVAIADVTVNGTPVKITDKGVVVQKDPLPGSDAMTQVVNEQLSAALRGAGLEVFLAPPRVTVTGTGATVAMTGVHVRYTAPSLGASVPSASFEYVLGEARAFAFAVNGAAGAGSSAAVAPSVGGGASTGEAPAIEGSGGSTSDATTTGAAVAPDRLSNTATGRSTSASPSPSTALTAPALVRATGRPTWLLVMYLIWQALVIVTAGVVLWWRGEVAADG